MPYESYDIYLESMPSAPDEYYKDFFYANVKEEFEDASTIKQVKRQDKHRDKHVEVRKVNIFSKESPTRRIENYQKLIFKRRNYRVDIGDTFIFDDSKWLCMSVSATSVSKSCVVQKTTTVLTLNVDGILHTIPACVEDQTRLYAMGYSENKYLAVPDSDVVVTVANTDIAKNIKRNDVYDLSGDNYKVVDINRIVKPGLIVLKMEWTAQEQFLPLYSLNIVNGTDLSVAMNNTISLEVELYDGSTLITPSPPFAYATSNKDIATVENGIITPAGIGNCIITVSYNDISANINLIVEEFVDNNYTISLYGNNEIYIGDYESIVAKVFNNGVEDDSAGVRWDVYNQDGSTSLYAYILEHDNHSITIEADNYKNKYIVVRGTLIDDDDIFAEIIMKIVSVF